MWLFNYENLIDPVLRDVRRIIPAFSGMKPGDRVLDICCGTGAQVVEYSRQGIIADGIDMDPSMLSSAFSNQKKLKLRKDSFYLADATALPFKDKSFDYVSVSLALHDKETSTRNKVVSEMKRVVKPDGALVLADFQVPLPINFWGVSVRIVEFLAGGSHYQGFKHFVANAGLEKILKDHQLVEEKSGVFKGGILKVIRARLL